MKELKVDEDGLHSMSLDRVESGEGIESFDRRFLLLVGRVGGIR